ncbi:hypothetical protein SK128_013774, partial [Halocaridina rubra]
VVVVGGIILLMWPLLAKGEGEQDIPSDAVLEAVKLLQDIQKDTKRLPTKTDQTSLKLPTGAKDSNKNSPTPLKLPNPPSVREDKMHIIQEPAKPIKEEDPSTVKQVSVNPAKKDSLDPEPIKEEAITPEKQEVVNPIKEDSLDPKPIKEEAPAMVREDIVNPTREDSFDTMSIKEVAPANVREKTVNPTMQGSPDPERQKITNPETEVLKKSMSDEIKSRRTSPSSGQVNKTQHETITTTKKPKKNPKQQTIRPSVTLPSSLKVVNVRVSASSNSIPMEKLVGADMSRHMDRKDSQSDESQESLNVVAPPDSEMVSETFMKGQRGMARVVKMRRPIAEPETREIPQENIDLTFFNPDNVFDFEIFGRKLGAKIEQKSSIISKEETNIHKNDGTTSTSFRVKETTPQRQSASTHSFSEPTTKSPQRQKQSRTRTRSTTVSPSNTASSTRRKNSRLTSRSRLTTSTPTRSSSPLRPLITTAAPKLTTKSTASTDEHKITTQTDGNTLGEEKPSFNFEPPPISPAGSSTSSSGILRPMPVNPVFTTTFIPQVFSPVNSNFLKPHQTGTVTNSRPFTTANSAIPKSKSSTHHSKPSQSSISNEIQSIPSVIPSHPGAPFRAPITPLIPSSSALPAIKNSPASLSTPSFSTTNTRPPLSNTPPEIGTTIFDFSRIPAARPFITTHPLASFSPVTESLQQAITFAPKFTSPRSRITPLRGRVITTQPIFTSPRPVVSSLRPLLTTFRPKVTSPSPLPVITTPEPFVSFSTHTSPFQQEQVSTLGPTSIPLQNSVNFQSTAISPHQPRITSPKPAILSPVPQDGLSTLPDAPNGRPVAIINTPKPPLTGFTFQSVSPGSSSSSSFTLGSPQLPSTNEVSLQELPRSHSTPSPASPHSSPLQVNSLRTHFSPTLSSTSSPKSFTPSPIDGNDNFTLFPHGFGLRHPSSTSAVTHRPFPSTRFPPTSNPFDLSRPKITTFHPKFVSSTTPGLRPFPLTQADISVTPTVHPIPLPQLDTLDPTIDGSSTPPILPVSPPNVFNVLQQQSDEKLHPLQNSVLPHPRPITPKAPFFQFFSIGGKPLVSSHLPHSTTSQPSIASTLFSNTQIPVTFRPSFLTASSPTPTPINPFQAFQHVPTPISTFNFNDKTGSLEGSAVNRVTPSANQILHDVLDNRAKHMLSPIPVSPIPVTPSLSPFFAAFSKHPPDSSVHSQSINEIPSKLTKPNIQTGGFIPIPNPVFDFQKITPSSPAFSLTPPPPALLPERKQPFSFNSFASPHNRGITTTIRPVVSTFAPLATTARGPFTFNPLLHGLTTPSPSAFIHTTTKRSITTETGAKPTTVRPILRQPIPPIIPTTFVPDIATSSSLLNRMPTTFRPAITPTPEIIRNPSDIHRNPAAIHSFDTSFNILKVTTAFPTLKSNEEILTPTTRHSLTKASLTSLTPTIIQKPVSKFPTKDITVSNEVFSARKPITKDFNIHRSTRKPMLSPLSNSNVIFQPAPQDRLHQHSAESAITPTALPAPFPTNSPTAESRIATVPSSTQERARSSPFVFRPSTPITGKSFIFVKNGNSEYRVVWA